MGSVKDITYIPQWGFGFNMKGGSFSANTGGGFPESVVIDGRTYFLLRDDDTSEPLTDDETNEPLYDEAA